VPRSVGATRSEGGRSPGQRGCFLEGQERIVCALEKAKPAIREGNQNPLGLELLSAAAERGNYPEAKPNRDGLKGRRTCKQRRTLRFFRCDAYAALFRRQVSPASPQVRPTANRTTGNVFAHAGDSQNVVTIGLRAGSERDVCLFRFTVCGLRPVGVAVFISSVSVSSDDGVPREWRGTSGQVLTCKMLSECQRRGRGIP
jgi:hypothetical protein